MKNIKDTKSIKMWGMPKQVNIILVKQNNEQIVINLNEARQILRGLIRYFLINWHI